jgi:hypothetical protein
LTSIALLIGIGIIAAVITLLFVFMFETIINNGEGGGGPKLSNPDKQFMKVESVADDYPFQQAWNSSTMKIFGLRKRSWNGTPYFFFEWNIRGQTGAGGAGRK